jgi:hypothetical protein
MKGLRAKINKSKKEYNPALLPQKAFLRVIYINSECSREGTQLNWLRQYIRSAIHQQPTENFQ